MSNDSPKKVRIMIVDDSPTMRLMLESIFTSDPGIEVVGVLVDGDGAVAAVERLRPDVIAMDYHLPRCTGIDVAREILKRHAVPIVLVSATLDVHDPATVAKVVDSGILALLSKPTRPDDPTFPSVAKTLCSKIKLLSEVRVVVRRTPGVSSPGVSAPSQPQAVLIGVSAGGPAVLKEIFSGLSRGFPLPILVAQHIPPGFESGLCDWLRESSALPVRVAEPGQLPAAGTVHIAPGGRHLTLDATRRMVVSVPAEGDDGISPSIARLFHSAVGAYGAACIGLVLTGMGRDGAKELKELKDCGAITIAQDKESAFIHGIPGEAIRLNAVCHVLSTSQIIAYLNRFAEPATSRPLSP